MKLELPTLYNRLVQGNHPLTDTRRPYSTLFSPPILLNGQPNLTDSDTKNQGIGCTHDYEKVTMQYIMVLLSKWYSRWTLRTISQP